VNGMPGEDGQPDAAEERMERYLDELLLALRGRPREARRLLSEVESHLRESIEAGLAAGLDKPQAVDEALNRFGPPAAVARGLPSLAAYRALLAQITETALLVISALLLAAGVAAVPTAILGLAGNPDLVTGDPSRPALTPERCQQLLHMVAAPSCGQALAGHHLQEVIRSHLLTGWLGFLVLVAWWALHVHRKGQPALLPAGFTLTVCGTLLGAVAAFLLAFGITDVAHGVDSAGGVIGSGDLVSTGATMLTVALLSWAALTRQATRPARNLHDEASSAWSSS
jgi:hypothetical protein